MSAASAIFDAPGPRGRRLIVVLTTLSVLGMLGMAAMALPLPAALQSAGGGDAGAAQGAGGAGAAARGGPANNQTLDAYLAGFYQQQAGLKTAFVLRPTEHGPNQATDTRAEQDWEAVASSFEDLADRLDC